MADNNIPQTVGEAKACGWAWLSVECRDCRHLGDIRLDTLAGRGPTARLGTIATKLACGQCKGRSVEVSLGCDFQSEFGQPHARRKKIDFVGINAVLPSRE